MLVITSRRKECPSIVRFAIRKVYRSKRCAKRVRERERIEIHPWKGDLLGGEKAATPHLSKMCIGLGRSGTPESGISRKVRSAMVRRRWDRRWAANLTRVRFTFEFVLSWLHSSTVQLRKGGCSTSAASVSFTGSLSSPSSPSTLDTWDRETRRCHVCVTGVAWHSR